VGVQGLSPSLLPPLDNMRLGGGQHPLRPRAGHRPWQDRRGGLAGCPDSAA